MKQTIMTKALFAAGVAGCMAFGSAQAVAAPQAAVGDSVCNSNVCNALCITRGYHYGVCYPDRGCICYRLYE
jgi:hypothetical protein